MRRTLISLVALSVAAATQAAAQQPTTPINAIMHGDFIVKTVPLHHLSSMEAVKLLSPYVQTNGGGVFEVSPNVRAVTIRELPKIFAEMMTVLGQYDRDPATITLNFQLIAAENSNTRDPGVAALDSLLRGVLKYTGYRLLTTSVASASEGGTVTQTLSADGETFTLEVYVSDMRYEGSDASVHLNVHLMRNGVPAKGLAPNQVLATGVTVPMGQTVVLGTSAPDVIPRALILTVRPQLASVKR